MEAVAITVGGSMISAVLEPMAKRAGTMIVDQCDFMLNINREIYNLQHTLHLIQDVLQVAEERQVDNINIRAWLRQLVDIGYEARDVLDDFFTLSASFGAKRSSRSVKFSSLPSIFSLGCFNVGSSTSSTVPVALPFKLRSQLASDIRSIRKRLDEMMRQKEIITIRESIGENSIRVLIPRRPEAGSFVNKQRDLFVGREDVKEGIIKKLLDHNDNGVHLVPIWGMGGVGKTTLARSIYNDDRVKEETYPSDNRWWHCVGEKKFNAKEIIMGITNESNTRSVEDIQKKLVEKFKGNRFLIVLDDVWDVDSSEWKLLWNPLTNVEKGGLIIITTRTREAIIATNTQVSHNLKPLSDEECWQIFQSHAFVDGISDSRPDLKFIGHKIVKKLKGLPLAAEVVGRSLLNEPDAETWTNFLESNEWKLRNNADDIMPALKWSYNRLPPHLKQCFAYFSLFPKDHKFDKKLLIEMWMAHDLIPNYGRGEQRRTEDIGSLYFKELINASLLQCVYGEYMMHDMIHDLTLLVSNEEFVSVSGSFLPRQMEKVRHITIVADDEYSKNISLCKSKRILTLYTTCWSGDTQHTTHFNIDVLLHVFKQLKSIRVLVLSHKQITEIPECISKLKHLRYLDISETCIRSLPNSLCELHNLQTLAVPLDAILPKDIVNMVNLRNLRANLTTCKRITKLTSLQELSSISICEDGHIRELGHLRDLRGELTIKGLENITCSQDAAQALMQDKTYIHQLTLIFNENLGKATIVTDVLDALQCPPNLTYLEIIGYTGLKSPNWMTSGKLIANLQTLKLSECHQLKFLPPLGELNSLKHLSLKSLHGVERLGDELYGKGMNGKVFFPSLESLYLGDMKRWKEWDGILIKDNSLSFFPCLKQLIISDCPKLVSVLPSLEICTSNPKDKHRIMNATGFMRSLSRLEVCGCHGLVLLQLDALVSLSNLEIHLCSNLTRIASAIYFATTIEKLAITSCEKLEIIDFQRLPSLRRLFIQFCSELITIPHLVDVNFLGVHCCERLRSLCINVQGLNSLDHWTIINCPLLEYSTFEEGSASSSPLLSLVSLPLQRLKSIQTDDKHIFEKMLKQDLSCLDSLTIEKLPKLENFSETEENNLYKLTSLTSLSISECRDLKSLPPDFQKLTSLKYLEINYCPQLQSLPAGGLPLSLVSLTINGCPLLFKRCKDESGLDWHKINHIRKRHLHEGSE